MSWPASLFARLEFGQLATPIDWTVSDHCKAYEYIAATPIENDFVYVSDYMYVCGKCGAENSSFDREALFFAKWGTILPLLPQVLTKNHVYYPAIIILSTDR